MVLKNSKRINFFDSLVGLMIKNGNKAQCQKILYNAAKKAGELTSINYIDVLRIVFKRLCTFVEIKTIKQRKRIKIIPKYLSYNRRFFVTGKLLLNTLNADKKRKSFEQKLSQEFVLLINSPSKAKSFLKKKEYEKTATKNKSNSRYRW